MIRAFLRLYRMSRWAGMSPRMALRIARTIMRCDGRQKKALRAKQFACEKRARILRLEARECGSAVAAWMALEAHERG